MAWLTDSITILRVLFNDLDSAVYSDERLTQLLLVSAKFVLRDADFEEDYEVDLTGETILPDPSDDEAFLSLVWLRAACLLDHSLAFVAAKQGFAFRDGGSSYDSRGLADARLKLLEKGYCASYSDALDSYLSGEVVAGACIMTPFRLFARGRGECR